MNDETCGGRSPGSLNRFCWGTAVAFSGLICLGWSLRPLSLEELTKEADWVVHGQVESMTTLRDDAGQIYRAVEVRLLETWKGKIEGGQVKVVLAGGTLGDRRVMVPGQAEFAIDEEVVLFLVQNSKREGVVIGLSQGKFEVRTEPGGGKKVKNIFHGGQGTSGENKPSLALKELKERVKKSGVE